MLLTSLSKDACPGPRATEEIGDWFGSDQITGERCIVALGLGLLEYPVSTGIF